MEKILKDILDVKKGNNFLSYIVKRVTDSNYRGIHKSQHNRYGIDELKAMLSALHEVVGDKSLTVPPADLTKDNVKDSVKKEYPQYTEVVNRVNQKIQRVTLNSLKKNFFVDFSRMGFIEKYDNKKKLLNPFKRTRSETIKISRQGLDLLNAKTLFERYKIFTDGVEKLLGETLIDLVSAIDLSDYRRSKFSFEEYTLIFSDEKISGTEKITILSEWRSLTRNEQEKVLSLIKEHCTPEKFGGNKNDKRDYHNWRNETQQIMVLLKTTVYFQVGENQFSLNTGDKIGVFKVTRSESAKNEYFRNHKVNKEEYYELHHIVPLSYVRNQGEYKLIDDYRNLVYIHKDKHREIKRDYIIFRDKNPKIYFVNRFKNAKHITAKNNRNAKFNPSLLSKMKRYNSDIVRSILGAEATS